jgi:epidermal growth factor receptor substrate 15
LRLIGHAQAGREPTTELALQNGPLPRFDGISVSGGISSPPPQSSAIAAPPLQPQGTGGVTIRIPPLTPEKVAQYAGLFDRQPLLVGNLLPGEQAKQIFEKSGLPNEILGRIWQLADTEQRGALVLTEFVIAMHLLTSMKTGALRALPNVLPAALYEAATRRGIPARQSPTGTGPISAIPRQLSGSAQMRTGSPLGRPPISAQATGVVSDWLVTPADKARFDQLYDDLDKTRKGFITGDEAVSFFGQSNLPEDTLAQIWDLADVNSEGRLSRDEFAIAMYLIRQQRTRRDGFTSLPSSLPANLIPPSMRTQVRPPTASSAFDIPPQPAAAPKSALDDLFGLDTPTAPLQPAAQAQVALSTGGSNAHDPFGTGAALIAPTSPIRPSPTGSGFKPFVPSSSFGRGLSVQATGDAGGSALAKSPDFTEDLLGDNDPEVSKKLTNDTAELANLSNQIGSLSKQMQEVQGQRVTAKNEITQASSQKKNFEQRLAQLRTMYEKEAGDVRTLQEQLTTIRNETKNLQSDCMTLEGTYQDLQGQHRLVLTGLQADQQENSNLKEKIRVLNTEISALKPQIEKLRSDARQQKGLVAINKKQLVTSEGERDKLKTEAEDLTKSNDELFRQINTSSPVSTSGQVASPTPSTGSGNNPFFRRTGSTDLMGAFASPPIKPYADKSFDDVFGPTFPIAGTPPPVTSFKPQNTGASTGSIGSFGTGTIPSPNISRQVTLASEPPAMSEAKRTNTVPLTLTESTEPVASSQQASPPATRVGTADVVSQSSGPNVSAFPIESVTKNAVETGEEIQLGDNKTSTRIADISEDGLATAVDSDPFTAMDQEKAKADFDDAFAAFTSAKTQTKSNLDNSKAFAAFDSEFPPISELERDDSDSDLASEHGFDDDFAPASPGEIMLAKGESKAHGSTTNNPAQNIQSLDSPTSLGGDGLGIKPSIGENR